MSAGFLSSAQTLLASLLGLARTRVELLSTELQEELARLATALLGALITVVLAALGLGFTAAAIVIALGEEHRVLAAGLAGSIFLALAALAAWSVRRLVRAKAGIFDASLGELQRDYEALKP